ncbi:MAG TPA: class I SAM-dependent methyltransferase [Planctomycetota bacterium]|nr:class I SAM-dependent methyltransferase [Planctomycetota bacterium]
MSQTREAPRVVDPAADARFREIAREVAKNPDDVWFGRYVEYEWEHDRHVYELLPEPLDGKKVLEFGHNMGATSIVLSHLGADVTAIEVSPRLSEVAKVNAARYGVSGRVRFLLNDRTPSVLPLPDASFDVITCNSVLEYVDHPILAPVLRELHRVLKPNGLIVITATASRFPPREVHSGRWLVNWVPRWVDRFVAKGPIQRGLWPWELRCGFGRGYRNLDVLDRGRAYVGARRRMGASPFKCAVASVLGRILAPLGLTVGLLAPNISMTLRKPA